jgi:hypothetical protein
VRRPSLAPLRVRGFPVADGRPHEAEPAQLVLRSGVFDRAWYELQGSSSFPHDRAAIAHYLELGRVSGLTPSPLFDPAHLDPSGWRTVEQDPLVSYLCGATGDRDPHPLFNEVKQRARTTGIRADLPGLVGFFALGTSRRVLLSLRGISWPDARRSMVRCLALEPGTWPAPHPLHPDPDPSQVPAEGALVSVVLPVRNRPLHVLTAIASVQTQTYPGWELLAVDDGSTDETGANLALLAASDPRIRVLSTPAGGPTGVAAARNVGMAAATGSYLAFLDSDYLWEPGHLEDSLAALRAAATSAVQTRTRRRIGKDWVDAGPPLDASRSEGRPRADINGLLVTRGLADEAGPFDEGLVRGCDLDWYWRVQDLGPLARTDAASALEHVDPSVTTSLSRTQPSWWLDVAFSQHLVDWEELRTATRHRPPGVTFVIAARAERGRTIDRVRALREHHPREQVEVVVVFSESGPRAVWSSAFTVLEARLGATVLLHPAATTGPSAMTLAAGTARRLLVLGADAAGPADDQARVARALAHVEGLPAEVQRQPRPATSRLGRLAAGCTVVSAADYADLDGYEPAAYAGG